MTVAGHLRTRLLTGQSTEELPAVILKTYSVLHCNGHLRKTRKVVVELMALASVTRRASVPLPFGGLQLWTTANRHYVPA
jgi:hypothetical protein